MNTLFVPYEISLKLKEMGFNGPCFGNYYQHGKPKKIGLFTDINTDNIRKRKNTTLMCPAYLYQQVIDWFYDKHNIFINATPVGLISDKNWQYYGIDLTTTFGERLFYDVVVESTKNIALNKAIEEAILFLRPSATEEEKPITMADMETCIDEEPDNPNAHPWLI